MFKRTWWFPNWHFSASGLWLTLIVVIACIVRFWNIDGSLMFLGDQGRDALIVSHIILDKDLVFVGPVTSVGNMYLGPFYYYFMAPFLFFSYPSPVGPAVGVAIVSVLTIIILYKFIDRLFGTPEALIVSIIFGFSATVVSYSRFSWNPNLAPFFSVLLLIGLFKVAAEKQQKYWLLVGLSLAALLQLHYVTLLVVPVIGLTWLYSLRDSVPTKKTSQLAVWTLSAVWVMILSLLPLFLFDIKHDWLNTRAFMEMFSGGSFEQSGPVFAKLETVIRETHGRGMHIFFETIIGKTRDLNSALYWLTVIGTIGLLLKTRGKKKAVIQLVALFIAVAIFGLSFYTGTVFDHYILYLLPMASIILGLILATLWRLGVAAKAVVVLTLVAFLVFNFHRYPFKDGGLNIAFIKQTTDYMHTLVQPGEKYNIMLLSASRDSYGQNYRYFLETDRDRAPVQPDEYLSAETLIIINEEKVAADPLSLPIYELVVFPTKEPSEIIKLSHGPELIVLRAPKD
ncbi:MAG: hypothetical protein COY80_00280 [Candidatus Pacebacteria bacterium CG_4_10_14_0_8_um_filter_42_14]|nr:MAG: hypothetical protein COY80_00280 [Candidatus Pacebacteria bacterium CG_4_10_14_0_8_um_filter_42_14]